jgi:hypothetical protein
VAKPTNPVRFGLTWVSRTDALTLADRAKSLRNQQNETIGRLKNRLDSFSDSMEGSTKYMDRAQRTTFRSKAISGKRSELALESRDIRTTYVRQLAGLAEDAKRAEELYTGPVSYLMLKTLGSERRALYQQQITAAGPAELRAMAAFATSNPNPNLDLAAALAAHVGIMKTADRPFAVKDLAEHLVGKELRDIRLALASAQLAALEGLDADTRFETGTVNTNRQMELAVLRKCIREEFPVHDEETDDDADNGDDQTAPKATKE